MIFILFVLNQSMVTKQIIIDRHWQLNLWNWSWRCVLRLLKNKDKFDDSDYPQNTLYLTIQTKGLMENTKMKLHLAL